MLGRIRAGVLEQVTVDLLDEAGVGARMHQEGRMHGGFEILFKGRTPSHGPASLTGGRNVMVYGQTEITRDLMDARRAAGLSTIYEASNVTVHDYAGTRPTVRFEKEGRRTSSRANSSPVAMASTVYAAQACRATRSCELRKGLSLWLARDAVGHAAGA